MGIAKKNDSEEEANKKLVEELFKLNNDLKVPSPREYGIEKQDFVDKLDILSKQALDSGSPGNNPVIPTQGQIKELYLKLWS